jgi:hypothetical protein
MRTGDVIENPKAQQYPLMRVPGTDPQSAAKQTVAEFLKRVTFTISAGDDGKATRFNLNDVRFRFPRNGDLDYPIASVTVPTSDQQAHNLSPTPLEDTWNRYAPNSVLWKTAELVADLQVDFFVNDEPTQEAIAAALPALFNPREDAAGVMLRGPATYWCLPVRATLMGDPERFGDTEEAVYSGERRLLVKVRTELDVVHLRAVRALRRPVGFTDVLDPKD